MKMNLSRPSRKAILIGCPSGCGNEYLSGVAQDTNNVARFLTSEKGGAWYDSEIQILKEASSVQVRQAIDKAATDYVFVYFSGHGFTDRNNRRILCCQDKAVSDTILFSSNPRQLIVVDACRKEVPPGIYGIPPEEEPTVESFTGSQARTLFDDSIRSSPFGRVVIYSTARGSVSWDTQAGGMFTNALLYVCRRIKAGTTYNPVNLKSVLKHIHQLLKNNENDQVPTVVYDEGNLTVPFAFGISKSELLNPTISQRRVTDSGQIITAGGWVAIVVGGAWFLNTLIGKSKK